MKFFEEILTILCYYLNGEILTWNVFGINNTYKRTINEMQAVAF
ncbi:hypothetical protein BDD39_002947 [Saccharococcus thermophilus]|uniref:Uncharacterized protein n=1 Tax=Saccharococcus thermophilus TaxID=29396 RepID=A0A846MLD4_9BACL|nr:hypothetical protein [Saccharococcus thermophilus]